MQTRCPVVSLLVFILMLGCETADPATPGASVMAVADQGPSAVAEAIAELPAPEWKMAALMEYAKQYPQRLSELCPLIAEPGLQEECVRREGRPHLWGASKIKPGSEVASGADAQLADAPASDLCAGSLDVAICAAMAAAQAANDGDARTAAQACALIPERKSQQECRFLSAEAIVQNLGREGYGIGVALCDGAMGFRGPCMGHLIMRLAEKGAGAAPESGSDPIGDKALWAEAIATAEEIRRTWEALDSERVDPSLARYWSLVIARATLHTDAVHGGLLDLLPKALHTHVRAAVAWRVLRYSETLPSGLGAWVAHIEGILTSREAAPGLASARADATGFTGLTSIGRSELLHLPRYEAGTTFMSRSRRLWSDDPAADVAICVLEAAYRRPRVLSEAGLARLMDEGRAHPHPNVQWTACRLTLHKTPFCELAPKVRADVHHRCAQWYRDSIGEGAGVEVGAPSQSDAAFGCQ
jgi:hypothetical protein